MKIIGTAAASNSKKHSMEISFTELSFTQIRLAEVKPVLVQVTTRAKKRRAPSKVAALPRLPTLSDPVQQARKFYDTELRPQMEERYNGQYIAIHPESRSYSVQLGYGKAFRALRMQQPSGPIIVHKIGFANSGLKARLRGEQP